MTDELDRRIGENARNLAVVTQEVRELRATVEDLQATIDVLEERAPDPERLAYEQMDREDKVTVVRSTLKRIAESNGGKHRMHYDDVQSALGGKPSPGHAYDLMDWAADADGFEYDTDADGTHRLRVDLDAVNEQDGFIPANKGGAEGPA